MTQPPYLPLPPQKYRPRARWFVIGVVLLLLAGASLVVGLVVVLRPLTQEDGIVAAGSGPVTVEVPPGEERALFTRDLEPVDCTVTDADGAPVDLRAVGGDFSTGAWTADVRFDTGAGDVVLDCTSSAAGAEVRVGQVPSGARFVGGLALSVGGPLLFGLAGFVVLVVTGILWALRPARPR